jgi:hypothetical protein
MLPQSHAAEKAFFAFIAIYPLGGISYYFIVSLFSYKVQLYEFYIDLKL